MRSSSGTQARVYSLIIDKCLLGGSCSSFIAICVAEDAIFYYVFGEA